MTARLSSRFASLKRENRAGLVAYVMASDPDHETCLEILRGLPAAGADVIELGFPFTDPMADGPSVQKAAQRALKAGRLCGSPHCPLRPTRSSSNNSSSIVISASLASPSHCSRLRCALFLLRVTSSLAIAFLQKATHFFHRVEFHSNQPGQDRALEQRKSSIPCLPRDVPSRQTLTESHRAIIGDTFQEQALRTDPRRRRMPDRLAAWNH